MVGPVQMEWTHTPVTASHHTQEMSVKMVMELIVGAYIVTVHSLPSFSKEGAVSTNQRSTSNNWSATVINETTGRLDHTSYD